MAANAKIRSDILLYGLGWEEVAWRAGIDFPRFKQQMSKTLQPLARRRITRAIDSLKRDAERKLLWR